MPAERQAVPSPFLNAISVTGGSGLKSIVVDPDTMCRCTRSSSPTGAWLCIADCCTVETRAEGEKVVWYVVVVAPLTPGWMTSHVTTEVGPLTGSLTSDC